MFCLSIFTLELLCFILSLNILSTISHYSIYSLYPNCYFTVNRIKLNIAIYFQINLNLKLITIYITTVQCTFDHYLIS